MDTLPYVRAGKGQALVLVHGYLGGTAQWQGEIDRFSARHDVIAPNLPGFGAAADRPGCDTIAGMAQAVFALLDALAVDRFALLGHSMGGMVVQEMARMRPHAIARLVLYGTGPLGMMPNRFEPLATSRKRLISDGVAATTARIGATWFKRGAEASAFPLVARIGARASLQAAEAALDAMAAWDGRAALPNLAMPTLLIWGDADRSYRWPQIEALWTNLPDVRLSVIPGAAHAAHLEKPLLFHAVLEDFLSEIEQPTDAWSATTETAG